MLMPEPNRSETIKLTRKVSQNYLRASWSFHKNEGDEYGINKRKASELGFIVRLKTANLICKEMNLNSFILKIDELNRC